MKTKISALIGLSILAAGCNGGGGSASTENADAVPAPLNNQSPTQAPTSGPSSTPSASPSPSPSASQGSASISTFSPVSSAATATGNVTVTGSGFTSGAKIMIDGVPLTTTFDSATQLHAVVPNHSLADVALAVKNADGSITTASNVFKYVSILQVQDDAVLLSDGTVNAWSRDISAPDSNHVIMDPSGNGQLKNVIQISTLPEPAIAGINTCAVTSAGQVACWGGSGLRGGAAQPTDPYEATYVLNQAGTGPLTGAVQVYLTATNNSGLACAIVGSNRNVYCWGVASLALTNSGSLLASPIYQSFDGNTSPSLLANVYGMASTGRQTCYVVGNYYPAGAGQLYCQGTNWATFSTYQYATQQFFTGIQDTGGTAIGSNANDFPSSVVSIAADLDGNDQICWVRGNATHAGTNYHPVDELCIGTTQTALPSQFQGEGIEGDPMSYGSVLVQEDSLTSSSDTVLTQVMLSRYTHCRLHGGEIECFGQGAFGDGNNYSLNSPTTSPNSSTTFQATSVGYTKIVNQAGTSPLTGVTQFANNLALMSDGSMTAFGIQLPVSGETGVQINGTIYAGLTSQPVPMTIWQ